MRRRCNRQVKNLPGLFTEDGTFAKSARTSVKGEINSSAPKNAVLEIDIGSRWKEEYRRYINIGTYLPH